MSTRTAVERRCRLGAGVAASRGFGGLECREFAVKRTVLPRLAWQPGRGWLLWCCRGWHGSQVAGWVALSVDAVGVAAGSRFGVAWCWSRLAWQPGRGLVLLGVGRGWRGSQVAGWVALSVDAVGVIAGSRVGLLLVLLRVAWQPGRGLVLLRLAWQPVQTCAVRLYGRSC
jgi:hypothetical protein